MKERKKKVRTKHLHILLTETEYREINSHLEKTTCQNRSDYVRRVLLKKPVTLNYRNQSLDEILEEMIRLKTALQAIGDNFNQAVRQLHTLDTTPEVRTWLLLNENRLASLLRTTEEIKVRMNQIYERWSQK